VQKIPKTKEQPVVYKMLFATNMEPWETFTNRMMRQPNIRTRSPMRVEPSEVDLEGWGDNAIKVTLLDLQQRVWEVRKMSLSTQRHGNLYNFEEVL
jgi:hypothetical protein